MKYKIKRMVDKNDKEKIYEVFNECYTKYGKLVYFVISISSFVKQLDISNTRSL